MASPFADFVITAPTQEQTDRKTLFDSVPPQLETRADIPKNIGEGTEQRLKEKAQEIDPDIKEGIPIELPRPKSGDLDWTYTNLYGGLLGNTTRGFNKFVSDATQPFIQAPTTWAAEKVLDLDPGSLDRNWLERILNSGDFESQQDIIPWIMSYGKGQKGTFNDLERYGRAAGYGLGMTATFALPTALMANSNHVARTGPLLTYYTSKYGDKMGWYKFVQGAVTDTMVQPWRNTPKTTALIESTFAGMAPLYPALSVMATREIASNLSSAFGAAARGVSEWSLMSRGFQKLSNWWDPKYVDAEEWRVISEEPTESEVLAKIGRGDPVNVDPEVHSMVLSEVRKILDDPASLANLKRSREVEAEIQMEAGPFNLAEGSLNPQAIKAAAAIEHAKTPEQNQAALNMKMSRLQDIAKWLKSKWGGLSSEGPLYVTDAMHNRMNHFVSRIDNELLEIDAPPVGQTIEGEVAVDPVTTAGKLISQLDLVSGKYETMQYPQQIKIGEDIRNNIVKIRNNELDSLNKWARKNKVGEAWAKVSTQTAYNQLIKEMSHDPSVSGLIPPRKTNKDLLYDPLSLTLKGLPKPIRDLFAHHAGGSGARLTGLPGKQKLKFTDWNFQRKAIMQEIGEAKARGDSKNLAILSAAAKHLDNFGAQFGASHAKLKEFNTSYKIIRDQFEHGDLIKMERRKITPVESSSQDPVYVIDNELIASHVTKNVENARSFMNLMKRYPEDPETATSLQGVQDFMYHRLAEKLLDKPVKNFATREAQIKALNDFARQNEGVLTELGLAKEFSTTANEASIILNKVATRNADLMHRRNVYNNSNLMTSLSKAHNDQMPEELFEKAVTNTTLMRQLRSQALKLDKKAPGTIDAFNAGVWNGIRRVVQQVPGQEGFIFDDPVRFKNWLVLPENQRTLVAGIGPKHYSDLKIAADAAERVFSVDLPEGIAPITRSFLDNISHMLGSTVASVSARITASAEGRISPQYAGTWILTRALSASKRRQAYALMERALYDPELANIMATKLSKHYY